MSRVHIDAGVCGFMTQVNATPVDEDQQEVSLEITSTCPHVENAAGDFPRIDAYQEIFCKLHETTSYRILSEHLPHVACPVFTGVLKAIEEAAHLALPRAACITFPDADR